MSTESSQVFQDIIRGGLDAIKAAIKDELATAIKEGTRYTARRSPEIAKLGEALAKAQGEMKHALADSANPFFSSRYADLASVWDACRDPLSKNGLSVVQTVDSDDPQIARVTTMLLHSSGEFIETTLSCKIPDARQNEKGEYKVTPVQLMGATITYLRRFSLAPLVGVATLDDNDGTAGQGDGEGGKTDAEKVTDQEVQNMKNLAGANGHDLTEFLAYWKIANLNELPRKQYQLAVNMLKKKAKTKE